MTNLAIIRALPPDVKVVNRTTHFAYPLPVPDASNTLVAGRMWRVTELMGGVRRLRRVTQANAQGLRLP
ncbi:hypothetical protein CB373_02385 [Salmonella enterica subsp. enterica serovar Westminster]|nr:hypothetical protein [Salmonella enterica]EDH3990709.1 hypothetical protein [Salmonella enterica subsp. enterica serovar Westminster]EDN8427051.1 hypothetical protein [Salmonella enterica subsp. enterica]EEF3251005.1 hypothetical protein [Salmonella enterica subsp. enterica serovar Abony]EDH6302199.1 hypothetical protein [Salmonella enterica subsp. enterica serovar Westminster]